MPGAVGTMGVLVSSVTSSTNLGQADLCNGNNISSRFLTSSLAPHTY